MGENLEVVRAEFSTLSSAVYDEGIISCQFLPPEAGLLNKRLMLSSSFRYDQIYKYEIYDFGHTLLCYLSRT